MTLAEEIRKMQEEMLPNVPAETLNTMMETTRRLVESGIAEQALHSGSVAPDFELPDPAGNRFHLAEALGRGPVVLNFYRGGWCPYCNLELKALDRVTPRIRELGATVVSISPNLPERSAELVQDNPFSFPVLCDVDLKVARQYGLVFRLADELRPIYLEFGIDLPAFDGNDRYELPMPATYVVGDDGIIHHDFVDADYTRRMEPDEILQALQRLA